jgi:hypothetical protein
MGIGGIRRIGCHDAQIHAAFVTGKNWLAEEADDDEVVGGPDLQ